MTTAHATHVGVGMVHVAITHPKPKTLIVRPDPVKVGYAYDPLAGSKKERRPQEKRPPNEIEWKFRHKPAGESVEIRLSKVLGPHDGGEHLANSIKDTELVDRLREDPEFPVRLSHGASVAHNPWALIFPGAIDLPHEGTGWVIPAGKDSIKSGPARSTFGNVGEFMVKYDVRLFDGDDLKAHLDPVIILVPDP